MNKLKRKTLKMPVRYLMNTVLVVLLFVLLSFMTVRQLVVLWRSRNRQCESVTLTPSLPENAWTHFAVVFKQVETHGQGEFDDSGDRIAPSSG